MHLARHILHSPTRAARDYTRAQCRLPEVIVRRRSAGSQSDGMAKEY
jgi:hypothetical protein